MKIGAILQNIFNINFDLKTAYFNKKLYLFKIKYYHLRELVAGRLALTAAEFLVADLTSPEATRPAAPNILLLNERNCLPYHVSTHQYGRFTRVV